MARYVLVHGSWHGGWCWYRLVPRLRRAGHEVDALDLPGHGRDWRPPASVQLGDYVDTVVRALDEASEPAVLVGHSMAGIVISQAAEARPERIRELVYLAAFLVPSGEAMLPTAFGDTESLIVANLTARVRLGPGRLPAIRRGPAGVHQGDVGPWVCCALPLAALVAPIAEASMSEALGEDFVRTARAKGLAERQVLNRHALPVSTTPIAAMSGVTSRRC